MGISLAFEARERKSDSHEHVLSQKGKARPNRRGRTLGRSRYRRQTRKHLT
jgi:hypothetical protein